MQWLELVTAAIVGLAICIPLTIALIKYVKKSVKEERWDNLMKLVFDLCAQAEIQFSSGADRKDWVMGMLGTLSDSIGYPLSEEDAEKVSNVIDEFISATKEINVSEEIEEDFPYLSLDEEL